MEGAGLRTTATCRACLGQREEVMEPLDPVGGISFQSSSRVQNLLADFPVDEGRSHCYRCRREVVSHRIIISYSIDVSEFEEEEFEKESQGAEGFSASEITSCLTSATEKCTEQESALMEKKVRLFTLLAETPRPDEVVAAVVTTSTEGPGKEVGEKAILPVMAVEKQEAAVAAERVDPDALVATPMSAAHVSGADVNTERFKVHSLIHEPDSQNQLMKLLHQEQQHQQHSQTPAEISELRSRSEPKSQTPSQCNGEMERLNYFGVINRRLRSVAFAIDRDDVGFTARKRWPRRQPVCVRLPLSRMELLERSCQGSSVCWRQLQQDFPAQLGGQLRRCGGGVREGSGGREEDGGKDSTGDSQQQDGNVGCVTSQVIGWEVWGWCRSRQGASAS